MHPIYWEKVKVEKAEGHAYLLAMMDEPLELKEMDGFFSPLHWDLNDALRLGLSPLHSWKLNQRKFRMKSFLLYKIILLFHENSLLWFSRPFPFGFLFLVDFTRYWSCNQITKNWSHDKFFGHCDKKLVMQPISIVMMTKTW